MAAGRFPSQVFAVGLELHARLAGSAWPAHPVLGPDTKVSVELGDEQPDQHFERVVITLNGDESSIDGYRRLSPPGSDETIIYEVTIVSRVPGTETSRAVFERLAVLAEVAQFVLFDTSAEVVRLLQFPGEVQVAHTDNVDPTVWQEQDGWMGHCVITMRFLASI